MGLNNQKIILVTAFEPFGGETMNPTEMILNKLPETIGSHRIRKALLPVDFERAPALAIDTYNVFAPDAVLMLGQAAGRSAVTPETTAKNIMNARIPDNAGFQPRELPIRKGRSAALYYLDGMCSDVKIQEYILEPCLRAEGDGPTADHLLRRVLPVGSASPSS